ncbi:hypothetical protein, partial [Treponema endosymbiont of Eucomonympha sp.]|uniref:hypothetical protein n=1 Tax=Treponema endosymbiont of Eucomonympha sp. TaxID=1580831 RepID=UPI001EE6F6C7
GELKCAPNASFHAHQTPRFMRTKRLVSCAPHASFHARHTPRFMRTKRLARVRGADTGGHSANRSAVPSEPE